MKAFPNPRISKLDGTYDGMDLRDYFAAAAMQGHLAGIWSSPESHGWTEQEIAGAADKLADAMMEKRRA